MHNFFEQEKCGRVSATTLGTSHQKVSPNEYHSICVSWWEKKKSAVVSIHYPALTSLTGERFYI